MKVIPIHKGGLDDVNNFRPISLLSIFDKIIEKLLHIRLYEFLEINDILFKNQFGFRKYKSTTHALIQITEQIRKSIENNKFGCGIFIDLRKALALSVEYMVNIFIVGIIHKRKHVVWMDFKLHHVGKVV